MKQELVQLQRQSWHESQTQSDSDDVSIYYFCFKLFGHIVLHLCGCVSSCIALYWTAQLHLFDERLMFVMLTLWQLATQIIHHTCQTIHAINTTRTIILLLRHHSDSDSDGDTVTVELRDDIDHHDHDDTQRTCSNRMALHSRMHSHSHSRSHTADADTVNDSHSQSDSGYHNDIRERPGSVGPGGPMSMSMTCANTIMTDAGRIWPFNLMLTWIFYTASNLALVVGIGFWSIYIYDRELIHPHSLSTIMPFTLNVLQHGLPFIFVILEVLYGGMTHTIYMSIPKKLSILHNGIPVVLTAVAYLIKVWVVHEQIGLWPYPFFRQLFNTPATTTRVPVYFIGFSVVCITFAFVLHIALNVIMSCIDRRRVTRLSTQLHRLTGSTTAGAGAGAGAGVGVGAADTQSMTKHV
jgi:FAR-17a/AIG1-like protein